MKTGVIFEFEGHTLDVGLGRLWRGRDEIALRPKSLALLVYFLEHPGRVIDKEELIASVWPDVIVSDDSLSQCLKDIRAFLGPEADGFLRTVPRRGYVIDEKRMRRRDSGAFQRRARPTLEVLPFRPLADDREHHWLAEGIVEDVTVALCKSGQLVVIPRYRPRIEEIKTSGTSEIAGEHGDRYLLEGSVRLHTESVRVSAKLVEARSGELIWADHFDRKLIDIFAIQDEITRAIVRHLEIELLPEEWRAIQLSRTEDIEAYTYYRHGRQLARHWTKSYLTLARRMFTKSTEMDPGFARAYAGIVLCDCYLMEWHAAEQKPQDVLMMADKALLLDAQLAEAHAARGFALYRSGRLDEAEASYKRALRIDRGCYEARLFAGILAAVQGRREVARAHFVEAANLWQEDYVATCFVLCNSAETDPARLDWARLVFERAERIAALQPENPAPLSRGACALVHLGDAKKAVSWITRALTIDPDDLLTQYNAAVVYALLGDPDHALQILKGYLPHVSDDMIEVIRTDGDLDGIRSHPGYDELFKPSPTNPGSSTAVRRSDAALLDRR